METSHTAAEFASKLGLSERADGRGSARSFKETLPTNAVQNPTFSASWIAAWLNINKRTVWSYLNGYPETEERIVNGNLTKYWKLEVLPESLQNRLRRIALQHRFRNAEEMLLQEPPFFKPAVALAQCDAGVIARARLLQQAQARALERRLSRSEWEEIAVDDYKRIVGPVSTRHCMDLLYRTVDRAGEAAEYWRLELYLPERPRRSSDRSNERAKAKSCNADFDPLMEWIQSCCKNPAALENSEIDDLWTETVQLFDELSDERNPKRLKRALLDYLWSHVPDPERQLASSPETLRRNFDRKLAACRAQGTIQIGILADGRNERLGVLTAEPFPQEDIERAAGYSLFVCGGRAIQGIRELVQMADSGLTQKSLAKLARPKKSKSYVNARFLKQVILLIRQVERFFYGKKAIDDGTPSLRRIYTNMRSMTAITADDFTWPVYAYLTNPDGSFILTRGQCLLYIDCRSLSILGWSIQPERNYNSLAIRNLDNEVCRRWGIPKFKIYERGIWKTANVVNNAAPVGWVDAHSPAQYKIGWAHLGVRIIHAKRARSKPAELVGGLLQNRMERVLGYCGRDERRDCPEVTRKNKLEVESGRVHPDGKFLTFDNWEKTLRTLIELYNNDKQEGYILNGRSPDQAFQEFWPHDDPPTPFEGPHWHLNAHWVSKRTVTKNGVHFEIGKENFDYGRAQWLKVGQEVLAWFNSKFPEILGVTDLKSRNAIVIERTRDVDFLSAMDADGPGGKIFRQETANVNALNRLDRTQFNVLKKQFEPTFRTAIVPKEIAVTGEIFDAGRKMIEDRKMEEQSRAGAIGRRAASLGVPRAACRNDEETREALDLMKSAREEQAKEDKKADI